MTDRVTNLKKVNNILIALFVTFLWTFFINWLMHQVNESILTFPQRTNFTFQEIKSYLFFGCLIAPLWEEIVFRYVPIKIARVLNEEELIWPTILLSSIVFGLGHNNGTVGLLNQGMIGIIFSYLYVKNDYSYISVVIAHMIWNILCITIPYFIL